MTIDPHKIISLSTAALEAARRVEVQARNVASLQCELGELEAARDGANDALDAYLRECGYIRHEPPTMETDPIGARVLAAAMAASEPWEYWASHARPGEARWRTKTGVIEYLTDSRGWIVSGRYSIENLKAIEKAFRCDESGKPLDEPTPDPNSIQPDGLPWEFRANCAPSDADIDPLAHWYVIGETAKNVGLCGSYSRRELVERIKEGRMFFCDSTGRALPPTPKVREFWTAADVINNKSRWHIVGDKSYMLSREDGWGDMNGYTLGVTKEVRDGSRLLSTPDGVPLYDDPSSPEAKRIIAETLGETP